MQGAVAVLDALKAAGILADQLDTWFAFLPFFTAGARMDPAGTGGRGRGYVVARMRNQPVVDRSIEVPAARA
ncbi:hypothetical protein HBB16_00340 [Pseudonocardia sp. MCCB 268]|nr:hypothetical protein [Pseudonocardia cytotoxica]